MRPKTLKRKLNKAINHWLDTRSNEMIKPLLKPMIKRWYILAKEQDDYREGVETYGYKDMDFIEGNMGYISDRWECAFRLKWIIDGVKRGSI